MDVVLSSYQQQTLKNAIDFLDKAKQIDPNKDPVAFWSNCSWSIISFVTCIESYLTGHILSKIGEDKIPNSKIKTRKFGFSEKIKYIENVLKIQISDSTQDWKNVICITYIRNDIIHFNKLAITSLLTVDNAEKARDACKYVIKRCKTCFGTTYPTWVEQFAK